MKLYSVHIDGGNIALIAARSSQSVAHKASMEYGNYNVSYVELATPEDIDWVRGMGGYVPALEKANA